jgi:tetratricopeptide (TPR) repeat protein
MKMVSTLAIAATVLTAGAALSSPAFAQKKGKEQAQAAAPAEGPKRNYTKSAMKALQELQAAANAGDPTDFATKLAAAQAAAKNADDRYFIGQMQLTMAQKSSNDAALREAVTAVLNSGGASAEESVKLRRALGSLAVRSKDYPAAIAAFQEVLKANPNDAAVQNDLIVIYREQKQYPQAIAILEQSIAASKAAGQKPPENTYKLALQTALDGKVQGKILPLTREFLSAYPTAQNWGTALDLYRSSSRADDATLLDTFRLMRTAKTLDQANEYLALADTLALGKFYAEARDVINEGVASGKLKASHPGAVQVLREVSGKIAEDRTAIAALEGRARSEARGTMALRLAEGYYGHGMYAKAAEFYRLALQKGGVDTNLVNTRLGMAHALGGQRAEAEAAFKAVTGPRADLAGFWMLWLQSRA